MLKIFFGPAKCAATFMLMGCYPSPHEFTSMPAIAGVLLNAGRPVSGEKVYVSQSRGDDNNYCRDMRQATITDSNGNFQVSPVVEHRIFASVLDPPQFVAQETSICFEVASQRYLGLAVIAPIYHPKVIVAACDLMAAPHPYLGDATVPGNPVGICSNPMKPFPSGTPDPGRTGDERESRQRTLETGPLGAVTRQPEQRALSAGSCR